MRASANAEVGRALRNQTGGLAGSVSVNVIAGLSLVPLCIDLDVAAPTVKFRTALTSLDQPAFGFVRATAGGGARGAKPTRSKPASRASSMTTSVSITGKVGAFGPMRESKPR